MTQVERYIADTFEPGIITVKDIPIFPQGKQITDGSASKMLLYYDFICDSVNVVIDGEFEGSYRYDSRLSAWACVANTGQASIGQV